MIDIYTEKNSKEWILQNDLYFNLNTSNEEMSEKEIDIIRQVDEVGVPHCLSDSALSLLQFLLNTKINSIDMN